MNTPILIVIAVLLSVIVAFFIAAALIIRKVVRTFQEFVTPAGEGKPSPLALFIDGASHQLAANLLMEAKASFMGTKSGEVRADKAACQRCPGGDGCPKSNDGNGYESHTRRQKKSYDGDGGRPNVRQIYRR